MLISAELRDREQGDQREEFGREVDTAGLDHLQQRAAGLLQHPVVDEQRGDQRDEHVDGAGDADADEDGAGEVRPGPSVSSAMLTESSKPTKAKKPSAVAPSTLVSSAYPVPSAWNSPSRDGSPVAGSTAQAPIDEDDRAGRSARPG